MRFRLTLQCRSPKPVLPLNYQYELSAWIYRVIRNADTEYADFLHRQGYQSGRKSFKLFCFSQLDVPRRRIEGDRLHILCPVVSFVIGFYMDQAAEDFIRGLFRDLRLGLGDTRSQADFIVHTVETLPSPDLSGGTLRLRTLSPLVVARKNPGENDAYLHPADPDFGPLLFLNLLEKYRAANPDIPPPDWTSGDFRYRLLTPPEPRSQLITLKAGREAQTKVRGWRFYFEVEAPPPLLEIGLLAGFGRMNGEGFGCVGVLNVE